MDKFNSKKIALGTLFLSFIMCISFCMIFLTNTVSADITNTVWQADKLDDVNIITQSTIPESIGKFNSAYKQNVTLEFSSASATNDGSGSIKGVSEERENFSYMRFAYDLNKNEGEWLEIGKEYKLKIKLNAPAGYKLKLSYYLTYPGTDGSYENHEIYVIDANKEIEGWEEFESERISLQYVDVADQSKGCVMNVGNESFNGLGTSLANLKVFFYVYSADNTQISSETLIALDDFYVYDIQGSKAFINDEYYISDADDVIIVSNKDEVVTQTEYQIASGNVALEYDSTQNAPDSKGGSLKYSGNGTTYKHMRGYVEKLEPGILYTWTVSVMVHDGQYRYLNATMLFQFSGGSANPYKSVENRDVALAQKNVNSGKGVWKTFYSNFRYEIDETGVYTFYDEKGDILFDTKTNYGGGATFEEGVQYTLNNIRIDLGTGSNETTYFHIDNVGIYQNVYAINNNVESVGYNIMPENNKMFVKPGEDFKFSIEVLEGYEKENFKVTANGQELTADEYGIYTLMSITSDTEIIVEGLKILSYEVKFFEENGATQIGETQIVEYGKSATVESAPDKTGYEFSHWVNMDNGEVVSDFTNIISNISVKAVYAEIRYEVKFFAEDGTTQIGETQSVLGGSSAVEEVAPEKTGHTFSHWVSISDGTTVNDFNNITSNISVKAVYSINSYEVKFFEEDGETQIGETQTVNYGSSANEEMVPDAKQGYRFAGWQNIVNNEIVVSFENITENISVKATYEKEVYEITITGATFSGNPEMGETITLTASKAPEGKEFDYFTVNGEKIEGNTFEMPASDVEVVAVYKDVKGTSDEKGCGSVLYTSTIFMSIVICFISVLLIKKQTLKR